MVTTMDEVLDLLKGTGPEYTGLLANHAPMAAEALVVLGRGEAVLPWVEEYRLRLLPHPESHRPISTGAWREAIGEIDRVGDWIAFFDLELNASPWTEILDRWTARLAPGLIGAAGHGLIRTAHAVRSLATEETPLRLHELAEGLAYWAARYQLLPGTVTALDGAPRPSIALRDVPTLPPDEHQRMGLISDDLQRLDDFRPFAESVFRVDISGRWSGLLSELTESCAHMYLAGSCDATRVFPLLHTVTATSGVRLIAPHLSLESRTTLLRHGFHAAAALYSAFGRPFEVRDSDPSPLAVHELIDRAVSNGDEHAIKFTEACLREYTIHPKAVYLAAASDAIGRI